MTVRPLRAADIPILQEMHRAQGFDYPFPDLRGPLIEAVLVVVDDEGRPVCAAAAEKLVQLYLFADSTINPVMMEHYVKMLHVTIRTELIGKHYTEACAALPPQVSKRFGRWLVKRFGWVKSWEVWSVRF